MKRSGFTLIELLIVVAIIAILAAIAVPNFLEAQTRAKVTRCKADMRSAAVAIESYYIDWNRYPFDGYNSTLKSAVNKAKKYNYWYLPVDLSTPVSYLTSVNLVDPFRQQLATGHDFQWDNVRYTNWNSTFGPGYDSIQSPVVSNPAAEALYSSIFGGWRMVANGPDRTYGPANYQPPGQSAPIYSTTVPYDPTNGTVSQGDVIRSQASPEGYK